MNMKMDNPGKLKIIPEAKHRRVIADATNPDQALPF